jgi:hypothetical protein
VTIIGASFVILGGAGLYVWKSLGGPVEDVLRGGGGALSAGAGARLGGSASVPRPGISFGNAYLDGRLEWLCRRFYAERRELLDGLAAIEETVVPRVHREAFSDGPWLAGLDESLKAMRQDIERQTVECEVVFTIPDVEPEHGIFCAVFSEFRSRIQGEGQVEYEYFLPPLGSLPACVDVVPLLARNQVLTRERWRRDLPLARPTDVLLVNDFGRDGACCFAVWEAWRNCGDSLHGVVRLMSGQYAAVPHHGGSLFRIRSFYSGQGIPPFMDGYVATETKRFYKKLLDALRDTARLWEPDEAVRKWAGGLGW